MAFKLNNYGNVSVTLTLFTAAKRMGNTSHRSSQVIKSTLPAVTDQGKALAYNTECQQVNTH